MRSRPRNTPDGRDVRRDRASASSSGSRRPRSRSSTTARSTPAMRARRRGGGHYQVRIVSPRFAGLSRIARHRLVYDALSDLMRGAIHALAIEAATPDEARGDVGCGSRTIAAPDLRWPFCIRSVSDRHRTLFVDPSAGLRARPATTANPPECHCETSHDDAFPIDPRRRRHGDVHRGRAAAFVALAALPSVAAAQNLAVVNNKPIPKAKADAVVAQLVRQGSRTRRNSRARSSEDLISPRDPDAGSREEGPGRRPRRAGARSRSSASRC